MSASVTVLHNGYVGPEDDAGLHVGSTVTLVSQGDTHVIVDPGLVATTGLILDPLRALGLDPEQVTDVVFSHQHIDHTLNAALFPAARFHDFAAVYQGDLWLDEDAEWRALADDIRLIRTPGHTVEDISTVVQTADGLIVCTHAWWYEAGPQEDPYAPDPDVLRASRERILALQPALVVPGHGVPFAPAP